MVDLLWLCENKNHTIMHLVHKQIVLYNEANRIMRRRCFIERIEYLYR